MIEHLTPAELISRMIGSPELIGQIVRVDHKSPYQWRRPSKLRDAGDIPSSRHMRALLAYAAARGIPLRAEHLIWGASRTEVDALIAASLAVAPVRAAE